MLRATVTAIGPVTVRLDGDTVSVPAAAPRWYTPAVGDRVRVSRDGSMLLIMWA